VLDLKNWKLTLPIKPDKDVKTKKNGDTYEVLQPELAKFQDKNCFFVTDEGKAVVLTVHTAISPPAPRATPAASCGR
jgi:hypothetical protein